MVLAKHEINNPWKASFALGVPVLPLSGALFNDHNEIKDKSWDERSEQVQDEIYYNSLKELFENYVMQDGTPIMDVIKTINVEWTA